MPNRIIKESILTSDTLAELSWFEQNVFFRLIVLCDDYGRTDARAAVIKGSAFALYSGVTEKQVQDAIIKLSTVGIANLYEVGGRPYLQLCAWAKHQTIRAKRSKYPEPPLKCDTTQESENICMQMQADESVCLRNPIQSNPNPIQSKRESKEGRHSDFFLEFAKENAALLSALQDFEKMRKQIKKPMTDKAKQLLVRNLEKLAAKQSDKSGYMIACLNQSILNCWQSVFELKEPFVSETVIHEAPPEWAYDPNKSFEEQLGVKF